MIPHSPPSFIISVAGSSASGKSLFIKNVIKALNLSLNQNMNDHTNNSEAIVINEDNYYRHRDNFTFEKRSLLNYDHPDAFERELLYEHLNCLKNGESINLPQYDFVAHLRKKDTIKINPASVIILEGIHILSDEKIRDMSDIKIYIDVDLDICLARRIQRDAIERGRTVDSVITQYNDHVRPMYLEFIEPSKKYADIIVPNGGENKVAIDLLEGYIHKLINERKECNIFTA